MYDVQLFGRLEVRTRGIRLAGHDLGGVVPRHILALLALRGVCHVTEVVDALWGDRPPARPGRVVESYVDLLLTRLDPTGSDAAITKGNGGYALIADRVRVDVSRFTELLAVARGRTGARAVRPLIAAAHLADRPLLPDEHTAWAASARADCRDRLSTALLDAAEAALANGSADAARTLAGRALEIDPSAERARAIAGTARHGSGDLLPVA